MREKIFHDEWRDSWRYYHPGCHLVKVPDMPRGSDARFNPTKPYDFYAVLDGKIYAMELKLKTRLEGFSFEDVTEGQINNLREAKKNGALAVVVINYRIENISARQRKKNDFLPEGRLNTVFVIDVDDFASLDRSLYSKSIPFKFMFESPLFKSIGREGEFWNIPAFMAHGGNK